MEVTYEEAQSMLQKRLQEYPEINALVTNPRFKEAFVNILELKEIDKNLTPLIEGELMVVLAFYAPITELAQNISASTKLPLNISEELVIMFDSILLDSIHDDLLAFAQHVHSETEKLALLPEAVPDSKERLELHPDGESGKQFKVEPQVRPLTRDELMEALAPKRTMAGDIEAVRQKQTE